MASIEVEATCKCGGKFKANGESVALGFRFQEWLEKHQPCLNREE